MGSVIACSSESADTVAETRDCIATCALRRDCSRTMLKKDKNSSAHWSMRLKVGPSDN